MLFSSLHCPMVPGRVKTSATSIQSAGFTALACLNDCQMREKICSDGIMNEQTRVFDLQCFLCVVALPPFGTFKGHKIGMVFFGG